MSTLICYTITMIEYELKKAESIDEGVRNLYEIISLLRSPEGCPWDRKQTEKTAAGSMMDEAYEYLEGLLKQNTEICKEEIGDVLINVLMILHIHEEKQDFKPVDALNDVCEKLIRRHPHVFGEMEAGSAEEGLALWNKQKQLEGSATDPEGVFEHIPQSLPPLEKSYEIHKKLSKFGFEWNSIDEVIDKIYEELDEVKQALKFNNQDNIEEEIGDVLTTVSELARYVKVRPNIALDRANRKLERRFLELYKIALERNVPLDFEHVDEMNDIWEEVKVKEN